jgi:hypothetical protein
MGSNGYKIAREVCETFLRRFDSDPRLHPSQLSPSPEHQMGCAPSRLKVDGDYGISSFVSWTCPTSALFLTSGLSRGRMSRQSNPETGANDSSVSLFAVSPLPFVVS